MTQQALDYWKSEIPLKKITALDSSVPKWLIEEEVTKYSENTVLLVSKIKISSLFKKKYIYIYMYIFLHSGLPFKKMYVVKAFECSP